MTGDNIQNNVREELLRGEETMRAAEFLLANSFCNDAVSRAYYACLYYVRALLLTKGLEPKSHHGAMQLLSLHFIKDGPLSSQAGSDFGHLQTFRELIDYKASAVFTNEQASGELERARSFIRACDAVIGTKPA